jgi:hypothetical protein
MPDAPFQNPFRPGVGHMPPHLAGRIAEQDRFKTLLNQAVITDNLILTGLRGVGKTVLLESLKPHAREAGWLWAGDDFTESDSLTEERIADSIVTDLSLTLAPIFSQQQVETPVGFMARATQSQRPLEYSDLRNVFDQTPGLPSDKLKAVLRFVGTLIARTPYKGIVFAYDEAQNLGDRAQQDEYPLSVLLDVFQSIQKSPGGLPFMLVLTGLPTLLPKLNETRTYTERMFDVILLDKLTKEESREAIQKPISEQKCPIHFSAFTVERIAEMSGGYPYFIQFICKEVYDVWLGKLGAGQEPRVPESDILRKLDQRFFSARWDKASDRQRDFMKVIAVLPQAQDEFRVQDIVDMSKSLLEKPFSSASAGMMLKTLTDNEFIFRNRRGKYALAVPLLDRFIRRHMDIEARLPATTSGVTR